MDPVDTSGCNMTYKGDGDTVGDLPCQRVEPGVISSFWRPTPDELAELNRGGVFRVTVMTEPIPPFAVEVLPLEAAL